MAITDKSLDKLRNHPAQAKGSDSRLELIEDLLSAVCCPGDCNCSPSQEKYNKLLQRVKNA